MGFVCEVGMIVLFIGQPERERESQCVNLSSNKPEGCISGAKFVAALSVCLSKGGTKNRPSEG